MLRIHFVVFFGIFYLCIPAGSQDLPRVFGPERSDVINAQMSHQAALAFQRFPPPVSMDEWLARREELRNRIIEKSGARTFDGLELDYHETGQVELTGGVVKMIYFQTRPGVYATANLYVPDGEGPFPAVVTMMGHSSDGKLYDTYRAIGYELVRNGYVSLHMDPWGAGERTTNHGEFQYHGAHLGASLLDVGETLLGMQLTDNMRGVDLLTSLPYVDASRIGATGASGGGNQTMWLTAMDDRIRAGMPVVSVGTFESYIMSSNCICETLPDGLTFMEEAEVLGLVAPRALLVCNAEKESNRAFFPSEMQRSLSNASQIYNLYNAPDHLQYRIENTTHGYHPEYRESLIGWMDLHLKGKGNGSPVETKEYDIPERETMMVFESGQRPDEVINTVDYCALRQRELSTTHEAGNADEKRAQLREVLKVSSGNRLQKVHRWEQVDGWQRYALETTDGYFIPILVKPPASGSDEFVIIAQTEGKDSISLDELAELQNGRSGICLVDLWGIGEAGSVTAQNLTGSRLPGFHTLSRSLLWLGSTLQGVWVRELELLVDWLGEEYDVESIRLQSNKDLALAGLFFSAMNTGKLTGMDLDDVPVSYAFTGSITDGYYTMSVHLPGFLEWGDVANVAALSGDSIQITTPRNLDGTLLSDVRVFRSEYGHLKAKWGTEGEVEFLLE